MFYTKCKQPRPGFELRLPFSFPITVTITVWTLRYVWMYVMWVIRDVVVIGAKSDTATWVRIRDKAVWISPSAVTISKFMNLITHTHTHTHICLFVLLFNGISTFLRYLMLNPSFEKNNSVTIYPIVFLRYFPKVHVKTQLEFELAYYNSAVQRFNHHITKTCLSLSLSIYIYIYMCVCVCVCVCARVLTTERQQVVTVVVHEQYCRILINEFEHNLRYYVPFRSNTIEKGKNYLTPISLICKGNLALNTVEGRHARKETKPNQILPFCSHIRCNGPL